jgi:hypothetical protein
LDLFAVDPSTRQVAVGHKGKAGEGGDSDGATELRLAPGAVGALGGGEAGEAPSHGAIEFGGHFVLERVVLGGVLVGGGFVGDFGLGNGARRAGRRQQDG